MQCQWAEERAATPIQLWIAHTELPRTVAHPFYESSTECWRHAALTSLSSSNALTSTRRRWGGRVCRRNDTSRLLLIGYFGGVDSERGIAWRAADSLGLRGFWEWDCGAPM